MLQLLMDVGPSVHTRKQHSYQIEMEDLYHDLHSKVVGLEFIIFSFFT